MCPLFSYAIIVSVEVAPFGIVTAGILLMPVVTWRYPVTKETFIFGGIIMDFLLNEDQQMIHDLAAQFAQDVLQPRIEEIEEGVDVQVKDGTMQKQLPQDVYQQMAECGFMGISFPEEYDGMGMGHLEQAIIIKEISRVSPSS